jgi:hypothetical protein
MTPGKVNLTADFEAEAKAKGSKFPDYSIFGGTDNLMAK